VFAVQRLRIVIADDESIRVMSLRSQLEALGHQVVGEAATGREVVEIACQVKPDLAILDIKMPEMDGIEAAKAITAEQPIPIILLTAYGEEELVERAAEVGVLAYLMKPVSEEDLLPTIALALARFREFQALHREVESLKEALETRKLVERAKGILMRRLNLSEEKAFRHMQRRSQNENIKLGEIARAIITTMGS
jgi:AmiR/NasT family two-component response regulator